AFGLLDQMRERLGVGLGAEMMALALEPRAQRGRVLDDAVVDQRDLAGTVAVRVGILRVGRSMRRPARVRDPRRAVHRLGGDELTQAGDAAYQLAGDDAFAVLNRDAGRVIPAILEAREPFEENRRRFTRAHVPYDAAHQAPPRTVRPGRPARLNARTGRPSGARPKRERPASVESKRSVESGAGNKRPQEEQISFRSSSTARSRRPVAREPHRPFVWQSLQVIRTPPKVILGVITRLGPISEGG